MKTFITVMVVMFTSLVQATDNAATAGDDTIRPFMSAEEAIYLAQVEPLKFVGFFVPSDVIDASIPSCVFRNRYVTVMYDYCSKLEQPAVGITIHSTNLNRGNVFIYAEGPGAVSKLKRKDYYDFLWFVTANNNASGFKNKMSAADYSKYYDRKRVELGYGCLVAYDRKNAGQARSVCEKHLEGSLTRWAPAVTKFWLNPSQNWYSLQSMLRNQINLLTDN